MTTPANGAAMMSPATPFFRDVRMPSAAHERYARERFLLDTLAERRAVPAKPPRWLILLRALRRATRRPS